MVQIRAAASSILSRVDYNGTTVVGLAVLILILAAAGVIWFRPQVNRAFKDKDGALAREREISDNFQKAFENSEKARLEQGEQLEKLVAGMGALEGLINGLRQAGSKGDRPEG